MDQRQFEVNAGKFVKKCAVILVFGSLIPAWMFIISEYVDMVNHRGYYSWNDSPPLPLFAAQFLCIPILGYQLPTYIISGLIGINFVKGGRIKPAIAAYLVVGIAGWFVSTLLLFIMNMLPGYSAVDTMIFSAEEGLPSLFLYLVFFFPKRVKAQTTE